MPKLVIRSKRREQKRKGENKSQTVKKMATGACAVLYLVRLDAQSCLTLCNPRDCGQAPLSMGTLQARILEWVAMLSSRGSSTQGSNPGLPHFRWILYHLSHHRSPGILKWVAYPFSKGSSQPRKGTRVSCIADGFFYQLSYQGSPSRNICINNYLKHKWIASLYSGEVQYSGLENTMDCPWGHRVRHDWATFTFY